MTRKSIDCRDFPDETGCTLYLSGRRSTSSRRLRSTRSRSTVPKTHRSYANGFAAT